ncbi:MAG: hypothetical protein JXR78_02375 [Victivallales bacterium]|nr:hypothetical protein [Victivallales bacterium]
MQIHNDGSNKPRAWKNYTMIADTYFSGILITGVEVKPGGHAGCFMVNDQRLLLP